MQHHRVNIFFFALQNWHFSPGGSVNWHLKTSPLDVSTPLVYCTDTKSIGRPRAVQRYKAPIRHESLSWWLKIMMNKFFCASRDLLGVPNLIALEHGARLDRLANRWILFSRSHLKLQVPLTRLIPVFGCDSWVGHSSTMRPVDSSVTWISGVTN